ncbi:MAG TPA: hypothetical protein EYG80_06070 [Flavobacteriaceae bacterium]|nr:hypothetical protein [Flavobacteriaceae bacterium]
MVITLFEEINLNDMDIQLLLHTEKKGTHLWELLDFKELKEHSYKTIVCSNNLRFTNKATLEQVTKVEIRAKENFEKRGHTCLEHLIDGEFDKTIEEYKDLLNRLKFKEDVAKNWEKAYTELVLMNKRVSMASNITELEKKIKSKSKVKKILVSGMGWSGSGALYDFFLEFKKVFKTPKEEFQHIEGYKGLRRLYEVRNNKDLLIKELNLFFWYTLFGYISTSTFSELSATKSAKPFVFGRTSGSYSLAVRQFLQDLHSMINELDEEKFKYLSKTLIDSIILPESKEFSFDDFILLDNVIHAGRIDTVELLENYNIFVTFRDPRSNYVAHYNENPRFNPDIDLFIESYRNGRKRFKEAFSKIKDKNNLHIVQFEDFILSQEYRNQIVEKLGINLSEREEFSKFKPWESEKNIFLHETFKNQELISKIENELKEYCYDTSKYKKEINE